MTWPDSDLGRLGRATDEMRVADVEADRRVAELEVAFEPVEQRARRGEVVRNDLEGQPHARARARLGNRLETAAECGERRCRPRESADRAECPRCRTIAEHPRSRAAPIDRRVSSTASSRPAASVVAFEYGASPDAADEAVADRRVHAPGGEPVARPASVERRPPRADRDSRSACASRTLPRARSREPRCARGGARVSRSP